MAPPCVTSRGGGIDLADHIGLITQAAQRARLRYGGDFDDWFSEAAMIVADAARTFDPAKGYRFSTHAVSALQFRLPNASMLKAGYRRRCLGRGEEAWQKIPTVGMVNPDGETLALPDKRQEERERDALDIEWLGADTRAAISKMSRQEREVAMGLMRGLQQTEIAVILNISRQRVNQIVNGIRPRLMGTFQRYRAMKRTA